MMPITPIKIIGNNKQKSGGEERNVVLIHGTFFKVIACDCNILSDKGHLHIKIKPNIKSRITTQYFITYI